MNSSAVCAYIGIGSNIGDREHHLLQSLVMLGCHPEIEVTGQSRIYETDPIGYVDQEPFLNMTAELATTLSPEHLLSYMLSVEQQLGRIRDIRWGPRTIDLDMLLYGSAQHHSDDLQLPHPRMLERAFVLVPLIELVSLRDPAMAEWLALHLEKLDRKEGVSLWKKI
ncbi:2-amino-4-hydroxy-6-hydroxymethyldihydropteridine diphosphokinase [Paenibacillus thalictri]|uniref:2-amino-4-hydroxy-6-hydroxymethyldihydropteridine diphosphokinase n=1 Tax=Paenibacillus thalictri TaxID=2527873 RepID=A0A4Q9DEV9_9BACL|nr:2-amino-4-hydroxy-6-hydroxymethyldihydropteridine diphosphokinase [Paenibacillus thalictri]TBL69047.1 2-amino-4-hydroxy-6-hydroxymethyldihydropteridine diphosphokinase [Paenibacillus thalictri]